MKLFKWSWTKFGIGIVVFIVTAILGRWLANYNIKKELGVVSSVNTEPQEDTDTILNDNLVYVDGKLVDMDSIPDNIVCIDGKLVNKDTKKVYSDINEVYSDMDDPNNSFVDVMAGLPGFLYTKSAVRLSRWHSLLMVLPFTLTGMGSRSPSAD